MAMTAAPTAVDETARVLRTSEEFLDRASRIAGIGAWELDLVNGELSWSAQTKRIHGVDPDYQPTLEAALAFYPPEVRSAIGQAVAHCAESGGYELELPLIRADGRRIWVRTVGATVFVEGKAVRMTGAFQDVTERVAEREALRAINERLTLATDSGGIGIWDWDLVGGRVDWDAWMFRIFGAAESEKASYEFWRRHVHPDDRQAAELALKQAIDGITPFDAEFRIVRGDGSVRHIRATATVARDAAGHPVRMVGTNWDITDRRRLAAKLAEQHELLRVTLRSIADGVITTDTEGRIMWLNPVAERLTGWSADEAAGQPVARVFNIVHQVTGTATELPVAACLASGSSGKLSDRTLLLARDGSRHGVEDSVAPIRNDRGDILGAVLVFHDVSQQRALLAERDARERALSAAYVDLERLAAKLADARDEAQRASQAKSRFLAGMSHELRTPLNGVLGYAQLLRAEGGLDAVQTARVDAMIAAGKHLHEMINSVLDLSEIEHERAGPRPSEVETQVLCTECLDIVRAPAEAKGLQLTFEMAADAAPVMTADATRLRQVLLNLLGNAVKFTTTGVVRLRLRPIADGRGLRFEVEDSGPGIRPDKSGRLFQDFDRLDIDATSTVEGAGLGLALSMQLATSMGGRLGFEHAPDGGSLFWLELPHEPGGPNMVPTRIEPTGSAPPRSLRVLAVDDVPINRDIVRSFLTMSGHAVICARDGAEAVATARSGDFDIVLMDVRMPGIDGLEATRQIRALDGPRGRVPIIGLTALAFTEQVAACREAGMNGHLAKPYGAEALCAAMACALDGSGSPAEPGRAEPARAGPAIGLDLPVLDRAVLARLHAFLPAESVAGYLASLEAQGRELLSVLRQPRCLSGDALASLTHKLAGNAGMLGFERLAKLGLRLERALLSGGNEAGVLAHALGAAIEATLEAISERERC